MSEKKETSAEKETLKGFFWALLIGVIVAVAIDIYNGERLHQDYWSVKLGTGFVPAALAVIVSLFTKNKVVPMVITALICSYFMFIGSTGILDQPH